MSFLPGFEEERPPQAVRLRPRLRALADRGVYFGTTSWKYEGWLGSVYSPGRYRTHGKLSRTKFERNALREYAETFPAVCGDFTFYQFPGPEAWQQLFAGAPESLRFTFKVPEDITVANWPRHARYGRRAGLPNEHFLDVRTFDRHFIRPLAPYRDRLGPLVFEFGTFAASTFPDVGHFLARLDPFLGSLSDGFRYSIEIRNPEFLVPDYLHLLASHNVAHCFNAWTRMPTLGDQAQLSDAFTADFTVVRALLGQGRTYDQAVQAFQPYDRLQTRNDDARGGIVRIVDGARLRKIPAYVFVNNRLEGHAPTTIEAVAEVLEGDASRPT